MDSMSKKLQTTNYKLTKGFTLVELLLYVALVSSVVLVISVFFATVLPLRAKNQTIDEVEQQGRQTMQAILQSVRNAENINSPALGTGASSLSLQSLTAGLNPTIFDLSSGAIRITEDAGSAINLTSPTVTASDLTFYNYSRSGTPGNIRVVFTLTRVNTGGRNEYDYSKTFYGSASLR